MKLFHFHHIGKRHTQEDDLYIDPKGKLFIVCDGVGGREFGEKASSLVIATLVDKFSMINDETSKEELDKLISSLNQEFNIYLNSNMQHDGMASTLVMLYLDSNGNAFISHIGDSRLYHIKSNKDWYVTQDHSMVMELKAAGILSSEEEMNVHPLRNRITKAVKISQDMLPLEPETEKLDNPQPGDLILLCSDGVMETYTSQELVDLLTEGPIEQAWKVLEDKCKKFANDNATAILLEL